jgi:hypothetical protein
MTGIAESRWRLRFTAFCHEPIVSLLEANLTRVGLQ